MSELKREVERALADARHVQEVSGPPGRRRGLVLAYLARSGMIRPAWVLTEQGAALARDGFRFQDVTDFPAAHSLTVARPGPEHEERLASFDLEDPRPQLDRMFSVPAEEEPSANEKVCEHCQHAAAAWMVGTRSVRFLCEDCRSLSRFSKMKRVQL